MKKKCAPFAQLKLQESVPAAFVLLVPNVQHHALLSQHRGPVEAADSFASHVGHHDLSCDKVWQGTKG